MNRTQKGALAVLIIMILLLIFGITIPFAWFNDILIVRIFPLFFLVLTYIVMGLSVIFLRKKRPSEVDYDERDITIKRKAILGSYITLWMLVLIACTIPILITGRQGITTNAPQTIPANLLPIALFVMFIIVMLVYTLMILVQYGWGGKDGSK